MVAFDAAGQSLLSCSGDGGRLWRVPEPLGGEAKRIVLWTEMLTGKTLDAGGGMRPLSLASWQRGRQAGLDSELLP
jgi:hypothetical protein